MIAAVRMRSNGPVNVNVFCHRPAQADPRKRLDRAVRTRIREAGGAAAGQFERDSIAASLRTTKCWRPSSPSGPEVVSFHFGLPSAERVRALDEAGIILFASATSLAEARQACSAGVDAIVAQGHEAGGHRGVFDPDAEDNRLGAMALTRILAREIDLPVIVAGGIMDGRYRGGAAPRRGGGPARHRLRRVRRKPR